MVSKPYTAVPEPGAEQDDMTIDYPCSDGEPLAESDQQYNAITDTVHALRVRYADRPNVYVSGDMFVYYRINDPRGNIAPDVFVVFGVEKRLRRSYIIWREGGKTLDVAMEIASPRTYERDLLAKRDIYESIGVTEYWRFDPSLGDCFTPPLAGDRLVDGRYTSIAVAPDRSGILRGYSEMLGVDLCVRDGELRLYDPLTQTWLLSTTEENAARVAAESNLLAAQADIRAAQSARLDAENARQAAEARSAALAALLREHGISPDAV